MAVTNYHTVEGRIIGSSSGGVRTDYLADALGSVTATVSQAPAVVNTYRYRPYGSLWSKTGAGADPKFAWAGSHGYRHTGRTNSDKYVRARHYGSAAGGWSSVDPQWPGEKAYGYCRGKSTTVPDPTGLGLPKGIPMTYPYLTYSDPVVEDCGYQARTWFLYFMRIAVPTNARKGYVIGHVLAKDTSNVSDRCGNGYPYKPQSILKREWWEAWCVKDGRVHKGDDPQCLRDPVPADFDDGWYVPKEDLWGGDGRALACRCGSWAMSHIIYFFGNVDYQQMIGLGFTTNGIFGGTFGRGQLKMEGPKVPEGWNDEDRARISLCISFNCCNDGGCSASVPPVVEISQAGPVKCKPVPAHG